MNRLAIMLVAILPAVGWAQAPQEAQRKPLFSSPLNWSVDLIINNYVRALSHNYKLSPEQEEYTRNFMSQRVKRFLSENEKDIRVLAAEMMDYRMRGEVPPPEIAREWGENIKQLLPAVKSEIMEGNRKWREILNDDQKKQHDRDLDLLDKQFDSWTNMVDRWANGNMAPGDLDQPGHLSPQPRTVRASEDAWEFFVRSFIQMYNLDEGQQQAANSVLRESKEQAAHYREAHRTEFSELDAADKAAAAEPIKADPDEVKKVQEAARRRLRAPPRDRQADLGNVRPAQGPSGGPAHRRAAPGARSSGAQTRCPRQASYQPAHLHRHRQPARHLHRRCGCFRASMNPHRAGAQRRVATARRAPEPAEQARVSSP